MNVYEVFSSHWKERLITGRLSGQNGHPSQQRQDYVARMSACIQTDCTKWTPQHTVLPLVSLLRKPSGKMAC